MNIFILTSTSKMIFWKFTKASTITKDEKQIAVKRPCEFEHDTESDEDDKVHGIIGMPFAKFVLIWIPRILIPVQLFQRMF